MTAKPISATELLAATGRELYQRGWLRGASGNFSVLLARKPLRLCITAAGNEIGALDETNFLELDDDAEILQGFGRPSDESLLHLTIYRLRPRARCILYSQSVAGLALAERHYIDGSIDLTGYEALKSIEGIDRFDQTVSIPLIDNSNDQVAHSHVLTNVLSDNEDASGIFIRRHGLYTWGETVEQARKHVEVLEFLFEVERQRDK